MPSCGLCGYVTPYQSYLTRHMLCHCDTRAFFCTICGSKFKTASAFNLHVREKHNASRPHVCNTCGLEFTHKRALDRHMLCHSEAKPFACEQCGYTCKRKQDLVRHVRAMHSGKHRRHRYEEELAN